jgi:hypothetical protein
MAKPLILGFVTLLVGVVSWPGLGATAMIPLSLQQLSQGAEMIVLGAVTSQASAWNTSHTAIYTDVTVDVEEAIKGGAGPEVTFRIAGGEVGHIGMRVSTHPTFHIGERVIVFLHTTGATAQLFGLQQGKFTVNDDTVTQEGQLVPVPDFRAAIRATAR